MLTIPWLLPLATATLLDAGIRPSFHLDERAWLATHVVVATEGERIDGELTVVASWRGDLEPGFALTLEPLRKLAEPRAREVFHWTAEPPDGKPTHVTGARMILFLKRDGDAWRPATERWGDIDVSVMWVEGGVTFAKVQVINPGPAVPIETGGGERAVRARFDAVRAVKVRHEAALATADATERAERLVAGLHSDVARAQSESIDALGRTFDAGLPTLRALIDDADLRAFRARLIAQLPIAGGAAVGPDLERILEVELRWWEVHGPKLARGWWSDLVPERDERLHRYGIVYAAAKALGASRWSDGRRILDETRALWAAHPALDEIGDGQIEKLCAAALR